ncbi:outer membrane beta-barrel protein [Myxococcaceae bacterium GXIMD 01537]
MKQRLALAISLGVLAFAGPALAQMEAVSTPEKRVTFNIGGILSVPIGDTSDRFDLGGGFVAGLAFNFSNVLSVQGEYSLSGYSVKNDVFQASGVDGDHQLQYGDLNAIVNIVPDRAVSFYVLGGGGIYYREVEITQIAGAAVVPYCDPWLFYCVTDVVPVEEVLASRSSTDFGLNGGVGVTVRLGSLVRLYAEARYHYIFGPSFNTPSGSKNANGQYLPFTLGLRF